MIIFIIIIAHHMYFLYTVKKSHSFPLKLLFVRAHPLKSNSISINLWLLEVQITELWEIVMSLPFIFLDIFSCIFSMNIWLNGKVEKATHKPHYLTDQKLKPKHQIKKSFWLKWFLSQVLSMRIQNVRFIFIS